MLDCFDERLLPLWHLSIHLKKCFKLVITLYEQYMPGLCQKKLKSEFISPCMFEYFGFMTPFITSSLHLFLPANMFIQYAMYLSTFKCKSLRLAKCDLNMSTKYGYAVICSVNCNLVFVVNFNVTACVWIFTIRLNVYSNILENLIKCCLKCVLCCDMCDKI